MKHIQHPLLNDFEYGGKKPSKKDPFLRCAAQILAQHNIQVNVDLISVSRVTVRVYACVRSWHV